MKTVLLISSALIIAFSSFGQTQNFDKQLIYQMTYQKDTTDIKSTQMELMELIMGESITIFQSVKIGKRDSINSYGKRADKDFQPTDRQVIDLRTPVKYSIYKLKNNSLLFKENLTYFPDSEENTVYYEEKPELDWELSEDTLTVSGFSCQKALLRYQNRLWTAWFTQEIPIEEGPYKFRGLPGLIIKMNDSSKTWGFELLGINSISRLVNLPDETALKKKRLTKAEFYKQKRYQVENETVIKETNGHLHFFDSSARQNMIEKDKMKSKLDNNWIERYP